jgi:hypothetical protein
MFLPRAELQFAQQSQSELLPAIGGQNLVTSLNEGERSPVTSCESL